jgi:hypothetical protein
VKLTMPLARPTSYTNFTSVPPCRSLIRLKADLAKPLPALSVTPAAWLPSVTDSVPDVPVPLQPRLADAKVTLVRSIRSLPRNPLIVSPFSPAAVPWKVSPNLLYPTSVSPPPRPPSVWLAAPAVIVVAGGLSHRRDGAQLAQCQVGDHV